MVIAAAWIFLHPQQYGVEFPKISAQPATLRLAKSTTIYELTICLGSHGTRDGYMRALRNLNPRYEADGWIPAGTLINATTRIAGLYQRNCVSGPRADLARTLITADLNAAIKRPTAASYTGSVAVGGVVPVADAAASTSVPTTPVAPVATRARRRGRSRCAATRWAGRDPGRHRGEVPVRRADPGPRQRPESPGLQPAPRPDAEAAGLRQVIPHPWNPHGPRRHPQPVRQPPRKHRLGHQRPVAVGVLLRHSTAEPLQALAEHLQAQGYTFVELFEQEPEEGDAPFHVLHVERVEIHDEASLDRRNQEFAALAAERAWKTTTAWTSARPRPCSNARTGSAGRWPACRCGIGRRD
jgi:hypothetical protein